MKYDPNYICAAIKAERKSRGMSQADLAEKINVSDKQISNYEKGRLAPPIDKLFALCEAFDCELGYLLGEEDYETGTKLSTVIRDETGLTREALDAIMQLTGHGAGAEYDPESDLSAALNMLMTSPGFPKFVAQLYNYETIKFDLDCFWGNFEAEMGPDLFARVQEAYDAPDFYGTLDIEDFEERESTLMEKEAELQKNDPDLYYGMEAYSEAIDDHGDLLRDAKMARYFLIESLEELIDGIEPKSGTEF